MNTWFTSDTHFSHRNIIKYCHRPWNSGTDSENNLIITDDDVLKMNDELIKNWNSVVDKDDIVWHLGDFALCNLDYIKTIREKLNGKINIVLGNHDNHNLMKYYECGFHRVYDKPILINEYVLLSHAPLMWIQEPMFNIYGHVHDNPTFKTICKKSCCVCVERWGYKPVSLEFIKEVVDGMSE